MKKLINTKGTEFEQNGKDLAIIDTDQRGGIPIMLDSADLDASIINGDTDALDKISVDVDNEPEVEVIPTTEDQTVIPGEEYTGLSRVTVKGVTSDVDSNIQPENILRGVNILGVTGEAQTGAYVLEDSNNYITDANKALILKIRQEISEGKNPIIYLHSRYRDQGWSANPRSYYICSITENTETRFVVKTIIPVKEYTQPETVNGTSYYHVAFTSVWCNLADGAIKTMGTDIERIPYPSLVGTDVSALSPSNSTAYSVSNEYSPAHKKYVDDAIAAIPEPDLSDYYTKEQTEAVIKGDIPIYKVQYTGAIPSNNYNVISSTQRINEIMADAWSKGYKTFGLFLEILTDTSQGTRISVLLMPITGNDWTTSTISRPIIFQGITQKTQGAYDTELTKVTVSINPTYHQGSAPTTTEFYIYGKALDFMLKSNANAFTPTNNYHPATKKYVDDAVSGGISSLVIGATHSRLGTDATNSWWVHNYNINTEVGNNALGTLANVILGVYNDCISFIKDINLTHLIRIHTLNDVLIEWKFGNSTSWNPKTYSTYVYVFYKNSGLIGIRSIRANPNLRTDGTIESWYNFDWSDTTLNALGVANTTSYTPTADYHPATKKYVDDTVAGAGASITEITITASQVVSQSPIIALLTQAQYELIENGDTMLYKFNSPELEVPDVLLYKTTENETHITLTMNQPGWGGNEDAPNVHNTNTLLFMLYSKSDHKIRLCTQQSSEASVPTEYYHLTNKRYVDNAIAQVAIPIIQTAASGLDLTHDASGSLENSDVQAIEDVATQMGLQVGDVKPVIMEVDSKYIFGSITKTADNRVAFGGIVTGPDNAFTSLFKAYTRDYSGILKAQWSNKVIANNSQVSAFEDLLATPVDISEDFEIDSNLSYASELSIRSLGNSWRRDETGEFNINVVIENTGSTDRSGLTLYADWSFGDDPEFIESDSQVLIKTLPTIKAGEQLILTGLYKADNWQLFLPEADTAVRVGLPNE